MKVKKITSAEAWRVFHKIEKKGISGLVDTDRHTVFTALANLAHDYEAIEREKEHEELLKAVIEEQRRKRKKGKKGSRYKTVIGETWS